MSRDGDFLVWTLILMFLVGVTWFFADQAVRPADIRWATDSCEANGGIEKLSADVFDLEVSCMNGAVFKAEKKAAKESGK